MSLQRAAGVYKEPPEADELSWERFYPHPLHPGSHTLLASLGRILQPREGFLPSPGLWESSWNVRLAGGEAGEAKEGVDGTFPDSPAAPPCRIL